MKQNKRHPISNFYIGELYLYTTFGNLLSIDESITFGKEKIESFRNSGAISFQKDLISRYTDWENRREYEGFLTIFYKQGDKYICLHDGAIYELNSSVLLENLIPLKELLPKINEKKISTISMNKALELFDILFKRDKDESILYEETEEKISDFFIGDIQLKERTLPEEIDTKIEYFYLPQHIMLGKNSLEVYSFGQDECANTVYRCLFLRDGVDLYNINNNAFYNHHEDKFDSIIPFKEYISEFKIPSPKDYISIPKALKLFKKTI